ncbi:SAC3 domain-containing protein 1 isoform X1 [Patella vulgata]|uniref:SAC3 domain-containing protein 1 isoform X1 n=2 Tax=Patella vulgata TaxID=6465 RepID=UPI00218047D0|nr:SAC3 domain-containing protein 1 isoform X1 [Patella vulgata]XP_050396865.1 SAC3 domain-containing protein 1 isoform X1 [Patella vulgata]
MDTASIVVGTCLMKCPQPEIEMREREGLLHHFEIVEGQERLKRPKCVIDRMVKEYKRPAAGQDVADPETLRPVPVLHQTIDYLYSIVTRPNSEWYHIYDYVFDRLRAVRQDIVIQDIQGLDAISLLEKIVRFYVLAVYRMGNKITPSFDPTINNQHTQECLKRLLSLYTEVDGPHSNQIEFESIYLMFNLGDTSALLHYLDLPTLIRNYHHLKLVYCASINYLLQNYVKCLRQIKKLTNVLCLCAAHRHLCKIQQSSLYIMSVAYGSKNCKYPTCSLEDLLCFNSQDEVENTLEKCGLPVKDGSVCFQKSLFKQEDKVSWKPWQQLENLLNRCNLTGILLGKSDRIPLPDISNLSFNDR